MSEVHMLYKLIILSMLCKVDFALSNSQISSFILEEQYTDYFTLQEMLAEMKEQGLLETSVVRNTTFYLASAKGKETLEYFGNQVSAAIRQDIEDYLKKNRLQMRNDNAVIADYFKTADGEFTARCQVKEKESVLVEVALSVPTEQQAIHLCDNWRKKNQEIYGYLMKELL